MFPATTVTLPEERGSRFLWSW